MMNIRDIIPKFCKEAGHEDVQWGLAGQVLKRLLTANPWWEEMDVLRVAHMARLTNQGKAVPLHKFTPRAAKYLYELFAKTKGGELYDSKEAPSTVSAYNIMMKKGRGGRGANIQQTARRSKATK